MGGEAHDQATVREDILATSSWLGDVASSTVSYVSVKDDANSSDAGSSDTDLFTVDQGGDGMELDDREDCFDGGGTVSDQNTGTWPHHRRNSTGDLQSFLDKNQSVDNVDLQPSVKSRSDDIVFPSTSLMPARRVGEVEIDQNLPVPSAVSLNESRQVMESQNSTVADSSDQPLPVSGAVNLANRDNKKRASGSCETPENNSSRDEADLTNSKNPSTARSDEKFLKFPKAPFQRSATQKGENMAVGSSEVFENTGEQQLIDKEKEDSQSVADGGATKRGPGRPKGKKKKNGIARVSPKGNSVGKHKGRALHKSKMLKTATELMMQDGTMPSKATATDTSDDSRRAGSIQKREVLYTLFFFCILLLELLVSMYNNVC